MCLCRTQQTVQYFAFENALVSVKVVARQMHNLEASVPCDIQSLTLPYTNDIGGETSLPVTRANKASFYHCQATEANIISCTKPVKCAQSS